MEKKFILFLLALFLLALPAKKIDAGGEIRNPGIFIVTIPIILGVASIFTMAILQPAEVDTELKTVMKEPLILARHRERNLTIPKKLNLQRDFLRN